MIEIKIDTRAVEALFKQLAAKTQNTRPAMASISKVMVRSVHENFKKEGRPAWKPLSRSRIEQRSKDRMVDKTTQGATWPGLILRETGRLEDSINPRSDNTTAVVGAFTDYAAAMQLGFTGSQSIPAHKRANGSNVKAHTRQMDIPARPFLAIQREDIKEAEAILLRHLLK